MDISTRPLSSGSGKKKSMGIALTALLIFGSVVGVMAYSQKAYAQAVLITTSADTFYGNSFVQVIINDAAKNSDSGTQETTSVTVRVKDDTGAVKGTGSINVREIGTNSGQFEFFITSAAAGTSNPASPRSEANAANAAVFRANNPLPATDVNDIAIDTTTPVAADWKFEIEYAGQVKTVNFATTSAQFNLDRTSAGSNNIVRFIVTDQDGNTDPTASDTIQGVSNSTHLVIDANNNSVVDAGEKVLITGSFTAGQRDFVETGPNTGVFELAITQGSVTTTSTSTYTFKDFDVYTTTSGAPFDITETSSTTSRSLVLQNVDGVFSPITSITFASEIAITLTDADRNLDSRTQNTFAGTGTLTTPTNGVVVGIEGGDFVLVTMKETGTNTGVFKPDLNNGVLQVSFVNAASDVISGNGVLELTPTDIQNNADIVIKYFDNAREGGAAVAVTSTLRVPISHSAGSLAFDNTKAGLSDKAGLTLIDNDLNNLADVVESYTFATSTSSNTFKLQGTGAGVNIGEFQMKIRGSSTQFSAAVQTVTLIETEANSGIFKGTLDISKINPPSSGGALADGDQIELKYVDKMESPSASSTASLTIGKPSTAISADKTTIPLPLTGDTLKVRLTVTDPAKNTNSGVQETISSGPGAGQVAVTATKSDGSTALKIGTIETDDINVPNFTLTETTPSSGVFSGQITVSRSADGTDPELDNARVKFTYDGNVVTVTLRPTDGVITTDATTARTGQTLTITISDSDRNKDPEVKDTFTFTLATQSDSIGGVTTFTAEETGPNTGVFTKKVAIGTDIKVTSVTSTTITQATELKITYTDAIASDLTNSVNRELVLKIGTSTGTMTVQPELVGPGTQITILTKDMDLNTNPQGVETINGATLEFLTLATDRSGFPTTKLGAEETGPNTGEFKTVIKLKPRTGTNAITLTGAGSKEVSNAEVLPGDLISLRYVDNKDANGNKVTASKVIKVQSWDPDMKLDKPSFAPGETITLTIADADANKDGEVTDSIKVKVTSSSDPVGFEVSGLETGPNTGVFTVSVTSTTSVSSGSITVANGGTVELKYTDAYPADYADRVKQVVDPSKDFVVRASIGTGTDNRSTTPSAAEVKDAQGNAVSQVLAGQQVVLSTTVKNNEAGSTSYAAIVEVRDSNDITVYLNWQTGTLTANGETGIGLSWTPDQPGKYTVKVYVLSGLANPRILSQTVTSTINVS